MIQARAPETPTELGHQREVTGFVLETCRWCEEVTRIGQSIAADGSQRGQLERRAIVLGHIASTALRVPRQRIELELDTTRNHDDLAAGDFQQA